MSEWMGVKVNGRLVSVYRFFNGSAPEPLYTLDEAQAVPVRIVEDAEPCDWERIILNNPNDVTPRTFGEYCRDECSHNYCPVCGRALRGDR